MKSFWVDYKDMCIVPQWGWLKKHWKGYTVLCILSCIIYAVLACAQMGLSWRDFLGKS